MAKKTESEDKTSSTGSAAINRITSPSRVQIKLRSGDTVSGMLVRPGDSIALLVLAHGAGAGMEHPFMETIANRLAARGVATLRYQFPYMEMGRGGPDRPPVLVATVNAALQHARGIADGLPIFAGGKSMGGRMTSTAAAELGWRAEPGAAHDEREAESLVHGIAFLGFPLHPPGKPGIERAAHLENAKVPLLFLQGTRDTFASLDLLRPVLTALGPRATLHVIDGADHGFHVPRSTGRTDDEVLDELADEMVKWMQQNMGRKAT
jgi:predicted alpha/beta-hydrolase family hydrolase